MNISYEKAALQEYMNEIESLDKAMRRRQEESAREYNSCKQQYYRIYTKLEEVEYSAQRQMEDAESLRKSAEADYETARRIAADTQDENGRQLADRKMQLAQRQRAAAEAEYNKAAAAYSKAAGNLKKLSDLWDENNPVLSSQARRVEDSLVSFIRLVSNGNNALNEYIISMEEVREILYGSSASKADSAGNGSVSANATSHSQGSQGTQSKGAASGGAQGKGAFSASSATAQGKGASAAASEPAFAPAVSGAAKQSKGKGAVGGMTACGSAVGWCASNSMTAVSLNESGQKMVSMTIGGEERSYNCTRSGIAQAYRHAKASGDQDMMARTSAMFEIETLRKDLALGEGEDGFAQIGGYHKDVKKQDPKGYESHHIPSRAVQDVNAEMLPAISITHDDHALTSSFAGKQSKVYSSIFSPESSSASYKNDMVQTLERGGHGYVDAIKDELLDLRSTTGHRYDGGISAYLDAVMDLLCTQGIPKAKHGTKK